MRSLRSIGLGLTAIVIAAAAGCTDTGSTASSTTKTFNHNKYATSTAVSSSSASTSAAKPATASTSTAAKPATTSTASTKPAAITTASTSSTTTTTTAKPPAATNTSTTTASSLGGRGMVTSAMAFPTGDRTTSVLLLERDFPNEVRLNQPFSYTMKVTNLTRNSLNDVVVRDQCASNFQMTGSNPGAVGKPPEQMTWALGSFGPGEVKTITVDGKATGQGQLTSCATVSYNSSLCLATNVVSPDLKVAISAPPVTSACDCYPVKIVVTNPGTGTASNVKVNYNKPECLDWCDGKAPNFAIGDLRAGESREMTFTVKPTKAGACSNSATASADGSLSAASETVATVAKKPTLALAMDCPKANFIGRDSTYKLTLSNTGDGACGQTRLVANVPAGAQVVGSSDGARVSGNRAEWTFANFAPAETKSVTLVLRQATAGTLAVDAMAECGCSDRATANCVTTLQGVPDIGTGIQDFDGVRNIGEEHKYTFVIKNQGQTNLTNIKVVGNLDEGSQFIRSTWAGGQQAAGNSITWNIGTLAVGEEKSFDIFVKATAAGEHGIETTTSCNEFKRTVRNDEQFNAVPQ
ncbi:MAG: DUF11 domain-containing protein [Phycisphaerales bacterium]|nr:MAG: DUF11 domain-containing protein [Phycisphaerales bacterium]